MTGHEHARCFIAATPSAAVLDELAATRAALERQGVALRWVRRERLHLTLKFLPAVPLDRLDGVAAALAETCAATPPLQLALHGCGLFGGRRPRVVWAGLSGDAEALSACAAALDAGLAGAGFAPERRPFRPHLTLARVPERANGQQREALRHAVEALPPPAPVPWRIDALRLVRSHLGRDARYETLHEHPLQGRTA